MILVFTACPFDSSSQNSPGDAVFSQRGPDDSGTYCPRACRSDRLLAGRQPVDGAEVELDCRVSTSTLCRCDQPVSRSRQARRPSRQCGSCGAPGRSLRSTQYAGRGAGRPSSAVVIRRTAQSIPASSKIASANSAHVQSPSAATCQTPGGSSTQLARRGGEMPDVRGRAALVVDHRHLVALGAEAQHRADEVRARPAEEPRRADDPRVLAGSRFRRELRAAVHRLRVRRVRLDVRLALRPVEDVVRRERDERQPSSAACCVPPTLTAAAPCGSSSAPSTFVQAAAWSTRPTSSGTAGGGSVTSHSARVSATTPSAANSSCSAAPSCPPAPVTRTRGHSSRYSPHRRPLLERLPPVAVRAVPLDRRAQAVLERRSAGSQPSSRRSFEESSR